MAGQSDFDLEIKDLDQRLAELTYRILHNRWCSGGTNVHLLHKGMVLAQKENLCSKAGVVH